MRTSVKGILSALVLLVSILALNNLALFDRVVDEEPVTVTPLEQKPEKIIPEPRIEYGLPLDSFERIDKTVARGESFGNILLAHGVNYPVIHKIATTYKDVFDVRYLRSGKPYTLLCEKGDSTEVARYMVYQPNAVDYYVFDLCDSAKIIPGAKEVTIRQKVISGRISSSLYETVVGNGGSPALVMELATIYAWTIDFFRIKKGDYFKVIYEEKYVDDTVNVGMGRVIAADFNHGDRSFYSFWYEDTADQYRDYFDEEGQTLRKAFLKAPLNYSRISSRYSPRRYHPVLKRYKAHLGTDYAAPRGTPIMATADGEVIVAGYTGGNGNYVKIRHNSTYTSQYLHMSRFARGITKGKIVKQGDVIGYVGSTGLATGPHVCYRFWVNGKQVDPYQQDLPDAEPIKEEYRVDYEKEMLHLKALLDDLPLPGNLQEVQLASLDAGSEGAS